MYSLSNNKYKHKLIINLILIYFQYQYLTIIFIVSKLDFKKIKRFNQYEKKLLHHNVSVIL